MLIKVNDNLYINDQQLVSLTFHRERCILADVNTTHSISANDGYALIAAIELGLTETSDALQVFTPETPAPTVSLKSKIAQMLRDTWKGVTIEQMTAILQDVHDPSVNINTIDNAVCQLENENIAFRIPIKTSETAWHWIVYHASAAEVRQYKNKQAASNAIPTLDLSLEDATPFDDLADSI